MNAGTRLIAVVAVIWALAAAGGADREQTQVSSATPVSGFTSKGVNLSNHNETLVRDGASLELASLGGQHNETLVRDGAR